MRTVSEPMRMDPEVLMSVSAQADAIATELEAVLAPAEAGFPSWQASLAQGLGPAGAPFTAAYLEATGNHLATARMNVASIRAWAQRLREAVAQYQGTDAQNAEIMEMLDQLPVDLKEKLPFKDAPPPEPVVDGWDPGYPHGKDIHIALDLPEYQLETLDNTEARTVYLRGESKIADLNEQWKSEGVSAQERAQRTFELRNALRTWDRDLMVDQAARATLDKASPNLTWEQMMQKEAAKGNTGNAAYEGIAASAARSRDSVNQSLGLDPKNPPPLPPARETPAARPGEPEGARPAPEPEGTRPSVAEGAPEGRMRPQIEGEGPPGRMRPQIEGETYPPGWIVGQQGEQRKGE